MADAVGTKRHDDYAVSVSPISQEQKLELAKSLLLGVALLFVFGSIVYLLDDPTSGNAIFETCKAILPPIGTLVIGYYFSQKKIR